MHKGVNMEGTGDITSPVVGGVGTGVLLVLIWLLLQLTWVFTALHAMQRRFSDENSVRPSFPPSVRLSVTGVDCDKTEERSVQIFYII